MVSKYAYSEPIGSTDDTSAPKQAPPAAVARADKYTFRNWVSATRSPQIRSHFSAQLSRCKVGAEHRLYCSRCHSTKQGPDPGDDLLNSTFVYSKPTGNVEAATGDSLCNGTTDVVKKTQFAENRLLVHRPEERRCSTPRQAKRAIIWSEPKGT